MVIFGGTTQNDKAEQSHYSSTAGTGTQPCQLVRTASQSTPETPLLPPCVVPSRIYPPYAGERVVYPSNVTHNLSSRASTVQCDEIISHEEFAHNGQQKNGKAKDAHQHGHVHNWGVNHVRVSESDKPRRPVDSEHAALYSFIKSTVTEQIQDAKPTQWQHSDGVIVYDKRDYDQASYCKRHMEDIMAQSDLMEPIRIGLCDSEQFVPSSLRVVDDVISKSSVIFVLLSVNSDTRQINFFCEEAVARLHIDTSNQSPFGAASAFDTPLKCILKPLQTAPSSRRMYQIPPGLMSMTSIDIFDYTSSFTRDKIISTLREAINSRIRQEEKDNTKREFSYMHKLTSSSQAPPPFSSHPMYCPAKNGDMQSSRGVQITIDITIKPSSLATNHHNLICNGDKHFSGAVADGNTTFIRPPSDHHPPQSPQTFYAYQMPYVQVREPPASPESEPNPMDLLPSYFSEPAPNPVSHPQYGVLISGNCHQTLLKQTVSIPIQ